MSEPQYISDEEAAAARRPMNRCAVGALFASAFLLAPIGAVLGIVAIRQIRKSNGEQQGMLLASIALVISVFVLPVALVLFVKTDPAVFNGCRALQHQAEGTLRAMRFVQDDFKASHGRYGTPEEVKFKSMYGDRPYLYEYVEASADTFLARATGQDEMAGDVLQVRAGGKLRGMPRKKMTCGLFFRGTQT